MPLQFPAGVKLEPVQEAVPQEVVAGCFLQAPVPSHLPVLPQGGATAQRPCGSCALSGTFAHIPALPVTLHALQVPQVLALQQTPSTQ
jgi:hypothetical protein